jgi:hypothetical protein
MATIAFFSGTTFFSDAVKLFTNSPISHAAIGFTGNDGYQYWLQAVGSGVQIIPRAWETDLYAEFQVLPNITNEVAIAEKKVGEPYSKLTILGFVIMIIAKWFGIGINNPFYEKSAVVCSQFVVEADTQHLISEFDGLDPANIYPAALFDICSKGKSFKRII